jgi:hypothetical protein
MSYLENGTTLRSQFSEMEPKRHHREMGESELLAHIAGKLGCDLKRASRAFDSMRNTKSRVLVFDAVHGQWRGCDWKPADKASFEQMLRDDQRALERKSIHEAKERRQLEAIVEKLEKNLEKLLARVEHLEQMTNQPEVSDKPSKNGFLEKKAQDRLAKKPEQEILTDSQRRCLELAMSMPAPDRNRYGRETPYAVNPLSKTVDSGDGYAETVKKHWQET